VKGTERPSLETAAKTFFDVDYKSNVLRLNFWAASLQMIKENPITGIGLYKWSGYYPKYSGDYFNDENLTYVQNIHAHNDFLELFAESGILAVLVFLLICLSITYSLFRKIKHNEKYFPLLLTFLITFAYSMVAFPNYKFASYFLATIAAGTALIVPGGKVKKQFGLKFTYLKWMLIAIIIIGGITSYIRLRSELSYGEAIFLKERRQYLLMLQKLENVSPILYPLDASKQPVDYYRGIANYYLRNYSGALNDVLRAGEIAPFNPIVLNNIAAAYEAVGNLDSAVLSFERIKILFPNYFKPQSNLLRLYYETGKKDKAKLLFNELIIKYPKNVSLQEIIDRYSRDE